MVLPLSTNSATALRSVPTRNMATPRVVKNVVRQPVNLRPMGNTVSMTVPAQMPFLGAEITVVTQASGGMAKPDSRMMSRRLRSPGFLGLSGELQDKAYGMFNQYDAEAANMNREQFDASGAKRAYWEGEAAKSMTPAAPTGPSNWSKAGDIFTSSVTTGVDLAKKLMDAKIAKSNAAAAAAQQQIAQIASKAGTARLLDVSQYGAGMAAQKGITVPLLIIGGGALAVALFLFLRKKGSAPAAA